MRRRQFAAPFVLVIATGSAMAAPVVEEKPSKCRKEESDYKCPPRDPNAKKQRTCNPPPPGFYPAFEAKVVSFQHAGAHVMLTVFVGSNRGVTKRWKVSLVTGAGQPVPGPITLERVDASKTIVKAPPQGSYSELRVRLTAC